MFKVGSVCVLFLVLPIIAIAQSKIEPSSSEYLSYRNRGNRFEGLVTRQVASPPRLVLINFTRGRFKYLLANKFERIFVKAPATFNSDTILVRALPIPVKSAYQMDCELIGNKAIDWNTGEVLYQLKLRYNDLGVLGSLKSISNKIYVCLDGNDGSATIHLILRASCDVHDVTWRIGKVVDNESKPELSQPKKLLGEFLRSDPIDIILTKDAKGNLHIEVSAKSDESQKPLFISFNIIIP